MITQPRKLILRLAGVVLLTSMAVAGGIQTVAALEGSPILEISGNIEGGNGAGPAIFDIAALEKVGTRELQTSTPWTDGRPVFEGVLMSDLLSAVGARGQHIVAAAINDYRVEIPISDFERYPVILAFKMNGERLKVRDKGPLWIIYPQDDFPELRTKLIQSRWVWQVAELHVR